jgi:uncharacterized protein YbaR (Trm112 family)
MIVYNFYTPFSQPDDAMDESLLSILACPKCRNPIRPADRGTERGLRCDACAVVYPVEDDIPILLVEEAVPVSDWEAAAPGAEQK